MESATGDWLWIGWVTIGAIAAIFFYGSKNASLKRRVFPYYLIFLSLFGFVAFLGMGFKPDRYLALVTTAMVLILYSNYRQVRFCDRCGRTSVGASPFSAPRECRHCGAAFK